MKKIHSRNSGRESEASILGNDREREFPLTPAAHKVYFDTIDDVGGPEWQPQPAARMSLTATPTYRGYDVMKSSCTEIVNFRFSSGLVKSVNLYLPR